MANIIPTVHDIVNQRPAQFPLPNRFATDEARRLRGAQLGIFKDNRGKINPTNIAINAGIGIATGLAFLTAPPILGLALSGGFGFAVLAPKRDLIPGGANLPLAGVALAATLLIGMMQ